MAIYRAPTRRAPIAALLAALLVGAVLGALAGRLTSPGLPERLADVHGRARSVAAALEVLRVEYPEAVVDGDARGADAAVARAREAYHAVEPDLRSLGPGWAVAARSLEDLGRAVSARAAIDEVTALIDASLRALDTAAPGAGMGGA